MNKKGFTLVELLVVIGILAVLGTATAIVLNPAELLNQSRDAQRVGDLSNLVSALSLYLSDVSPVDLGADCTIAATAGAGYVYRESGTGTVATTTFTKRPATNATVYGTTRAVTGSGWLPVDFTDIASGSPFAVLPVDPTGLPATGTGDLVYRFACNESGTTATDPKNTFELNAKFESTKYTSNTGLNLDGKDGGSNDDFYEVGTDPALDL